MKKLLTVLALTGFVVASAVPSYAEPAEGKGIGQGEKGDRGSSADAPGQTGDTGKANAPGQTKGE